MASHFHLTKEQRDVAVTVINSDYKLIYHEGDSYSVRTLNGIRRKL